MLNKILQFCFLCALLGNNLIVLDIAFHNRILNLIPYVLSIYNNVL